MQRITAQPNPSRCKVTHGKQMASDNYELLDSFLGNWFHEDWDLEASDWQQLVEKFKTISRKERVEQVHLDLKQFLKEKKNDSELCEVVFDEFGCCYDPRPQQEVRAWLTELAAALKPPRKKKED